MIKRTSHINDILHNDNLFTGATLHPLVNIFLLINFSTASPPKKKKKKKSSKHTALYCKPHNDQVKLVMLLMS